MKASYLDGTVQFSSPICIVPSVTCRREKSIFEFQSKLLTFTRTNLIKPTGSVRICASSIIGIVKMVILFWRNCPLRRRHLEGDSYLFTPALFSPLALHTTNRWGRELIIYTASASGDEHNFPSLFFCEPRGCRVVISPLRQEKEVSYAVVQVYAESPAWGLPLIKLSVLVKLVFHSPTCGFWRWWGRTRAGKVVSKIWLSWVVGYALLGKASYGDFSEKKTRSR